MCVCVLTNYCHATCHHAFYCLFTPNHHCCLFAGCFQDSAQHPPPLAQPEELSQNVSHNGSNTGTLWHAHHTGTLWHAHLTYTQPHSIRRFTHTPCHPHIHARTHPYVDVKYVHSYIDLYNTCCTLLCDRAAFDIDLLWPIFYRF